MSSPVKMLCIGMAVMLLVLKPEVGLAIVTGVSVGVQGIAESFQKESDNEIVEDVVEKNDATALILDQLLQEFKSLKDKSPQIIIEEREASLSSKHQSYKDALEKQYILENKAIYHGSDPIVRQRLNLPPKLPSFEQWNPTAEVFDKEFNAKFGSK